MAGRKRRLVVVTRPTPYEESLLREGTADQAKFLARAAAAGMQLRLYRRRVGRATTQAPTPEAPAPPPATAAPDDVRERHERVVHAREMVLAAAADGRAIARIDRSQLSRFFFQPDDIVVVVGQDGLVANVSKYVHDQLVVGINPDPSQYDGLLCQIPPSHALEAIEWAEGQDGHSFRVEKRAMAVACRENGQQIHALNDLFIGHRSHQSARYKLALRGQEECQSSSGLVCSTGTGATGWARSIMLQRGIATLPPGPVERRLLWFVREPFPTITTGTSLTFGQLGDDDELVITSRMDSGVVFADGVEDDFLEFNDGQSLLVHVADRSLNLVIPARAPVARAQRRRLSTPPAVVVPALGAPAPDREAPVAHVAPPEVARLFKVLQRRARGK